MIWPLTCRFLAACLLVCTPSGAFLCNLGDFLLSSPSELNFCALFCAGGAAGASPPSEPGAQGPPSELGGGRMPGALFRVRRGWVRGVWRRLAGEVGSVEVGVFAGEEEEGIRSVSHWKICDSCLSAATWRPGCLVSSPCNFLIACTKSAATRFASSAGDSRGSSQCWG